MSKIAEQTALEAYPIYTCYKEQCMMQEDINLELRTGYEEGYDQAMQDFLEKAEEFLYLQLNNDTIECGNIERLIDDFKNYMQDEM